GTQPGWVADTRVLVQEGGEYGRMARCDDRSLGGVFIWRQALHLRKSTDDGRTWEPPRLIAAISGGLLANAELLALPAGEILAFYNFRPIQDSSEPHVIGCCRSLDGGATWTSPVTIYQ